ncbi:MAG TPA: hypothetical protein VFH27_02140 [Longimicrobiaceae bacterium]|nr:hypothetical protein [Longimicrobiaceae bacterium]
MTAAVILLAGAAITAPRCARFLDVDSCLDNGGAWDYTHGRCVHDRQP